MKHLPILKMTVVEFVWFWSKISVRGPDDCWLWKEHVDKNGYPPFRLRGHRYKAARIVLFLTTGVDPGPFQACHRCNNPTCCNPAHLYAGTQSENLQQAITEKRALIGDHNGKAKLIGEEVRRIRLSDKTNKELAKQFNVSKETICAIRNHRTWKHVT